VFGDGPRNIVFNLMNHCVDRVWEEPSVVQVLDRLGSLGRVVMIDYRGFGASDPVPLGAMPTPETWMEDATIVLDELQFSRVHMVCHGSGGFIGMLFAAMHPDRTDTLTLIEPSARLAAAPDYPIGFPAEVLEAFVRDEEQGWGTERHVRFWASSRSKDKEFAAWFARFERGAGSKAEHVAQARWMTALDVRAVLPSIQAPTLVINHADAIPSPVAHAQYISDHVADADLVVVPGSDYWFSTDQPETIFDHVEEFITGAPPTKAADRALATLLFTDIVESTSLATRLGDAAWMEVLKQHAAITRRHLERHRGTFVDDTGDGVLATFDGPARALHCALAVMNDVRRLGVQLRAGVHVGEIERRGPKIGGLAVHIGQRVCAAAGAGEVLASRIVTDLVVGSGLSFAPRGMHQLKGVPGQWPLFELQP
jgi:pimeloyl-ACP methyl ester carboxylesterase/class 3 adenylate cyclase